MSVACVTSHHAAACGRARREFHGWGMNGRMANGWMGEGKGNTHITLPMSRKRAPGLQILMASSRHLRAVRITRNESSSTRPTGYVSFRSLWKPIGNT